METAKLQNTDSSAKSEHSSNDNVQELSCSSNSDNSSTSQNATPYSSNSADNDDPEDYNENIPENFNGPQYYSDNELSSEDATCEPKPPPGIMRQDNENDTTLMPLYGIGAINFRNSDLYEALEGINNKLSFKTCNPLFRRILQLDNVTNLQTVINSGENYDYEGKFLLALIQNIESNKAEGTNVIAYTRNMFSGTGTSRKPNQMKQLYDRFIIASIIGSGSSCVVLLFESRYQSHNLMIDLIQYEKTIGSVVAIYEPRFKGTYLSPGKDLPILHTATKLIPLVGPIPNHSTPIQEISEDAMISTNAFHFNQVKVKLTGIDFITANCDGFLCDRQYDVLLNMNRKCACFSKSSKGISLQISLLVYDKETILTYSPQNKIVNANTAPICKIDDYKSFKMFQYLISNERTSTNRDDYNDIKSDFRAKFHAFVQKTNEDGGWQMSGWYRRGKVADPHGEDQTSRSLSTSNTIFAEEVHPHISYFYPFNKKNTSSYHKFKIHSIDHTNTERINIQEPPPAINLSTRTNIRNISSKKRPRL